MFSSDQMHKKNCSYYNKILPDNSSIFQLCDDKDMEKELFQGSVVHMYKTVIAHAENGEGYVVNPQPAMKCCSQRRKMDSFILMEFTNLTTYFLFG